ncbi:MAG: hypothetical protein DWH91_11905 [Planctomycetota bacterium]|nr:MAG: hypothetical protein DWH91_11905 [Planctomycetota bacterium]
MNMTLVRLLSLGLKLSQRRPQRASLRLSEATAALEDRRMLAGDSDDQISEARFLGDLSATRIVSGPSVTSKDVDMFSFTVSTGQRVTFDIDRPRGRLDSVIRLFSADGTQLNINDDGAAPGEPASLESYLDVTFVAGGTYYMGVSGYSNWSYSAITGAGDIRASTGRYTLTLTPQDVLPPAAHTLYLNFDGASMSNSQLLSWAGSDWSGSVSSYLDPEEDGITVGRFFDGYASRSTIIAGIMANLQADLAIYGIAVEQTSGLAVTGTGSTTIFFGDHNMTGIPHVACDIDYNNNNQTDIAFVLEEDWGNAADIITALSDVALHEAGHTYGLFHVNSTVSSVIYSETMGLRYSTSESEWLRDTLYMDQTFSEYLNHGGGRGSQNSHQTMLQNFGLATPNPLPEPYMSPELLREIFITDEHMPHDHDHDHGADGDDSQFIPLLMVSSNSGTNAAFDLVSSQTEGKRRSFWS